MKTMTWLIITCMMFALTGCGPARPRSVKKGVVSPSAVQTTTVEDRDVRLAEVVLKPKPHKLSVKADPFRPLSGAGVVGDAAPGKDDAFQGGIRYLGMVKVMDKASVLIKTAGGNAVYNLNELVDGAVLSAIDPDFITLTKDGKTAQIKRGAP